MGIEERTQQIGIRPYQQKDKQAVRGICIATSGLPVSSAVPQKLFAPNSSAQYFACCSGANGSPDCRPICRAVSGAYAYRHSGCLSAYGHWASAREYTDGLFGRANYEGADVKRRINK